MPQLSVRPCRFQRSHSRRRPGRATAVAFVLAAGLLSCGGADRAPSATGPNVFVIVIDAASAFYFGLHGDVHDTSPNFDRLARESVVFENAYSQSATTVPSTASLVTGVRVMTHQLDSSSVLPEAFPTVAELFAEQGYRSFAFIGNPNAGAPELGLTRGYDTSALVYATKAGPETSPDERKRLMRVQPADMERSIAELLPEFGAGGTYAYFHYLQPHKPYDAPASYLRDDGDNCLCEGEPCACGDVPWDAIHDEFLKANETGVATPSVIHHLEARYRANIRFVDEALASLLAMLRERGLYQDALIVVTSDHGDAFFGHQRFGHNRTLYDDMVRVPLLMKFPAGAGVLPRRIPALTETVDVIPTIFDFLGFPMSPGWEGESLWPLISEGGEVIAPAHREVILATNRRDKQAIRVDDYKYIVSIEGPEELYDLKNDPGETRNLAQKSPLRVAELRRRLRAGVSNARTEPAREANDLRSDPEMNALLEALGYVEGPAPGRAEAER